MPEKYKLPPLQCDVCGKFLAYADIESGAAVNRLEEPDNAFGPERYERLCPTCAQK